MDGRKPGRPRSQAAHEAILRASIQLIRQQGYAAVTMDGIATSAGVGKATLYRRWKTKEDLVCDALEGLVRRLPTPDTGTTRGDLLALMADTLGLYADPATAGVLTGLVSAMHQSDRIAQVVRGGFPAAREAALLQVLKRGVKRGDLRPRVDVQLVMDMLQGPLFYRFLFSGKPLNAPLTHGLVNAILEAFGGHRRASKVKQVTGAAVPPSPR